MRVGTGLASKKETPCGNTAFTKEYFNKEYIYDNQETCKKQEETRVCYYP